MQYAFLQAMYNGCALIVNRKWIENVDPKFRELEEGHNCLAADNEKELAELLDKDHDVSKIVENAIPLFEEHVNANWSKFVS